MSPRLRGVRWLLVGCAQACAQEHAAEGAFDGVPPPFVAASGPVAPLGESVRDGGGWMSPPALSGAHDAGAYVVARDAGVDAAIAPPLLDARFTRLACGPSGVPSLPGEISGLSPLGIAAVYEAQPVYDPAASGYDRAMTEALGYACPEGDFSCQSALAELLRYGAQDALAACAVGAPDPCPHVLVLRDHGQPSTRLWTREELLAQFGIIDSLPEAGLLAAFDRHPMVCATRGSTMPIDGTASFADAEGVHLRTTWEDCGLGVFVEEILVRPSGVIDQVLPKTRVGTSLCDL